MIEVDHSEMTRPSQSGSRYIIAIPSLSLRATNFVLYISAYLRCFVDDE